MRPGDLLRLGGVGNQRGTMMPRGIGKGSLLAAASGGGGGGGGGGSVTTPTIVGSDTSHDDSGFTQPSGTLTGDLILVAGSNINETDTGPDPATGWTTLYYDFQTGSQNRVGVWWREADADGTKTYGFYQAFAGICYAGYVIRGHDAGPTLYDFDQATATSPAVAGANVGDLVFSVLHQGGSAQTPGVPAELEASTGIRPFNNPGCHIGYDTADSTTTLSYAWTGANNPAASTIVVPGVA